MSGQPIPSALLDTAIGMATLRSQQAALRQEHEGLAETYLDAMKALSREGAHADLLDAMRGFKIVYGSGWEKRAGMAGLPKLRTIESRVLSTYNDGQGRWRGVFPLAPEDPRPGVGTWVVYQLWLGREPQYIGSTGSFAARLKAHGRDKVFDSWQAAECDNERHCRDLETALIDRYRPPLNRMIPTPRLVLQ